jgi:hypothetical protein
MEQYDRFNPFIGGGGIAQTGQALGNSLKSYADPPATLSPAGGITEGFAGAERISASLLDEINTLEQRLATVLRPASPTGATAENAGNRLTPSAMANGLRELNDRLLHAVTSVRAIASRLDL